MKTTERPAVGIGMRTKELAAVGIGYIVTIHQSNRNHGKPTTDMDKHGHTHLSPNHHTALLLQANALYGRTREQIDGVESHTIKEPHHQTPLHERLKLSNTTSNSSP